jgi:hypothetical protein
MHITMSSHTFSFFTVAFLGFMFLFVTTLGNSVYLFGKYTGLRALGVLKFSLGIVMVVIYCFLSYFLNSDIDFIDTSVAGANKYPALISLVLGGCLLIVQIVQLVRMAVPPRYYESFVKRKWMVAGAIRLERQVKLACTFKANKLVENALLCHTETTPEASNDGIFDSAQKSIKELPPQCSAVSDAMLRFSVKEDETERSGGIMWTIKKVRDSSIFTEEGLWLFPRLVSSNMIQWVVVVGFIALIGIGLMKIDEISEKDLEEYSLRRFE